MAKIIAKGTDEYVLKLSLMGKDTERIAKKAVYKGAGIIADQMKANIDSIRKIHGYQREDLKASMGITPIELDDKGVYNAKIGFDGYGSVPTKKYPKGIPNQMLARAVESGTSFRPKTPFVRSAVASKKKAALESMKKQVESDIKEIMEG